MGNLNLLVWIFSTIVIIKIGITDSSGDYINEFAVEFYDGDPNVVDLVATSHGCRKIRHLVQLGNVYHFQHSKVAHRSKRSALDVLEILMSDPNIKRVEQQRLLHRDKRDLQHGHQEAQGETVVVDDSEVEPLQRKKRLILHDKQVELPHHSYDDKSVFRRFSADSGIVARGRIPNAKRSIKMNDPYFGDQWYLLNFGQSGGPSDLDLNVVHAWRRNITGSGVVVSILDDGIEHTHPDLKQNYDPEASADLNDESDTESDPMPDESNTSNNHGTRCAGEVAAVANNSICGVGVAYNARIGGIRMLDGRVTDLLEAQAVNYAFQHVDIYSASWGPRDNGKTMEGPGTYCSAALRNGVERGRGGKGSIFVWATGNGGMYDDDCSADGYVSSIYSMSIGSISDKGFSTYFSEVCPSTMAVVYTGGSHADPTEEDYHTPKLKVTTTDLHGGCTLNFQGTSSAAPLAAGCAALTLEANPNLTWRDMQYILVDTAKITSPDESGWRLNGAGKHVNHKFGFGVMDCSRMVAAAQNWVNVPPQRNCTVKANNKMIAIKPNGMISQELTTNGCQDDPETRINQLEHTQVTVSMNHSRRGDLSIWLVSPSGTRSEVLSLRSHDDSEEGIEFTFMTVHNWGEDPRGTWRIEVHDKPGESGRRNIGDLISWSLRLYGIWNQTLEGSLKAPFSRSDNDKPYTRDLTSTELKRILDAENEVSQNVQIRYNGEEKVQDTDRETDDKNKDAKYTRGDSSESIDNLLQIFNNLEKAESEQYEYKRDFIPQTKEKRVNTKEKSQSDSEVDEVYQLLKEYLKSDSDN